ncbi:VWA domain-containing protein [Aquihabitans sp. McL0605]|uniref:VWA domain-containing protein n=1 Tax=Aquihabitans sp. McL0605 TaxID=3415671 RepID=UPI003CEF8754
MSFLHAERLWLLLGVVALAAGYIAVLRLRARSVARYTNPELYDRLAPDRPGPVRHVAPALAMGALALTLVAVAQPTRQERVPREKGVVVLAIDTSLSMNATDISPTRIQAAIAGAKNFVDELPPGIEVGLVAFDSDARLLVSPTTDHESVDGAIASLTVNERTATGEGVYTSLDAVKAALTDESSKTGGSVPAAIVLLSDGVETVGRSVDAAAASAAEAKVPVSTIAYGTPTGTITIDGQTVGVPADPATMAAVAKTTGGTSFEATSAGELHDVYAHIQTTIGYETVPREVGRAFIGGAFLLLLLAGGIAIFTSARPL